MSKEILVVPSDDGKFELYDSSYDVVIHCKSQQGTEEVSEILRKYGTDEKAPNASFADPVRHGRWKCRDDCGVTECSACGWSIEEYVGDYAYCPNCGAKME